MVKEYIAPIRIYEYPFELVMKAYERRFPTTPHLPTFVGSEILNQNNNDDGSIQIVERRCKVEVNLPYLLKKIAGVDYLFFIQKNTLNNSKRVLEIEAWNESFSGKVAVRELCFYKVHPDNPDWTIFEQKAEIQMLNFYGFENMIEKFGLKTYATQIKKAKEVLPIFIDELKAEGITHVPIFNKTTDIEQNKSENLVINKSTIVDVSSECNSEDTKTYNTNLELLNSMDLGCNDDLNASNDGLNLLEQNCLMNMKRKWEKKQNQTSKIDDTDLLRFLRGNKLNEKRAYECILNYVKWRRSNNVDTLLNTWSLTPALRPYFLGGWHHFDNMGRPIYIMKLGKMDFKGLLKCIGCSDLIKQMIFLFEEALCKLKTMRDQHPDNPHNKITCIFDLDGLTMRHAWRPIMRTFMKLLEISERYYPETLGLVIITNTPKFFTLIWPLVQAVIADETKNKFVIYSKNVDNISPFTEHIPQEFIPEFMGGNSKLPFDDPPTPLIPKSLYLDYYTNGNNQLLECCLTEYNYKAATITRMHNFHIPISIDEVDNIISWDFDVLEGSANFRISFTTTTGGVSDNKKTCDVPDHEICVHHEGSSIQGSLICNKIGTYNLIWEFSDSGQVVKPKTKIIYYHEIIPPQKFRSSLHSLSSSFSDISQFDSFDCRYSQHIEYLNCN